MSWQPPDPAVIAAFAAALPDRLLVERRKMFGCPCAFVNGNMFAGVHEANLLVRLPPAQREELLTQGGRPFAPMGRTMKEYVMLPQETINQPQVLAGWLAAGFDYAASLPPKQPKPPRRKSKS